MFIQQKQKYAESIVAVLEECPFLKMPSLKDKQPSWYAFIIQYKEEKANGVSVEEFFSALYKIGLKEVDKPNSTSPIYDLALFKNTNKIISRFSYNDTMPDKYATMSSFWKRKLLNDVIPPLFSKQDELIKNGLNIFGIQGNFVGQQIVPIELNRSERF